MTDQNNPLSAVIPNHFTEPLLPDTTRFGPIRIGVTDPSAALEIWRDVVGLNLIGEAENLLSLGIGESVLVELETGMQRPVMQRSIGLYHVALHVPSRVDLAQFVLRAVEAGVRIAPTDHLVSEAVYLWDRDGNGIEMTFETPWRGTLGDPEEGFYGTTKDGKPHSGREPIDLDELMGELSPAHAREAHLPEGTRIGHVHLHVRSLDAAMVFYRDVLGFGGLFILRQWGMGDAGLGYMPHAIAFNIWAGPEAVLPSADHSGLRYFTIRLPSVADLDAVASRVKNAGIEMEVLAGGFSVRDPSGNNVHLISN